MIRVCIPSLVWGSPARFSLPRGENFSHFCTSILPGGITQIPMYTYAPLTDIKGRSQTPYTAPSNSHVSHDNGAQIRVFGFSPTTQVQKQAQNKCVHDLCAPCSILCAFIFMLRPQLMQVTCAPDKSQLFWLRKEPENPQFEPHAGIKMAQILGSPLYICGATREMQRKRVNLREWTGITIWGFKCTYFQGKKGCFLHFRSNLF